MIIYWHLGSKVKDNKAAHGTTIEWIEPIMAQDERYYSATKTCEVMSCPRVVEKYNGRMAGTDKVDVVTLLYSTRPQCIYGSNTRISLRV